MSGTPTRFFVRVELHGTKDYEKLHEKMKERHFKHGYQGNELPPGTYVGLAEKCGKTRSGALAKVKAAIKAAGQNEEASAIVIVKTDASLKTSGLDPE